MNPVTYDRTILKHFMKLFPTSPMVSLLGGYLAYTGISLSDDEDDQSFALQDDPFDTIIVRTTVFCAILPLPIEISS